MDTFSQVVEEVEKIALTQIRRDIHDTFSAPCGVSLDESTLDTLHRLSVLKAISLAEAIYSEISLYSSAKKKSHLGKEVAHMTEFERCVLIALAGGVVSIFSAWIVGMRAGRKAVEEFRSLRDRSH